MPLVDISVYKRHGARGVCLLLARCVMVGAMASTEGGGHITLSLTIWKSELSLGIGYWEGRRGR